MRLVNIESPFASRKPWLIQRIYERWLNRRYLIACMRDSIARGEAPIASHLLYPQVLNDNIPAERDLGIQAGLAWNKHAYATIVYTDRGISPGMKRGIQVAEAAGRRVEYRSLRGKK